MPARLPQPTFGLEEPQEEYASHLAGGPSAGFVLGEGLDHRMVLVVRQQCFSYTVSDGGVLLVEPGGNALDTELLLPGFRNFQQVRARVNPQREQEVRWKRVGLSRSRWARTLVTAPLEEPTWVRERQAQLRGAGRWEEGPVGLGPSIGYVFH